MSDASLDDLLGGAYLDDGGGQDSNKTVVILILVFLYALIMIYFSICNPEIFQSKSQSTEYRESNVGREYQD